MNITADTPAETIMEIARWLDEQHLSYGRRALAVGRENQRGHYISVGKSDFAMDMAAELRVATITPRTKP